MCSVITYLFLDVPKPAAAPAAAPNFTPGLLDAAFSSAPVANNQDMFDKAFGAPDSSPFGVPPVAMVQRYTNAHHIKYHSNNYNNVIFFS